MIELERLPWVYRTRARFVRFSMTVWTAVSLLVCVFAWGDRWGFIESLFAVAWGLSTGLLWALGMWALMVAPRLRARSGARRIVPPSDTG